MMLGKIAEQTNTLSQSGVVGNAVFVFSMYCPVCGGNLYVDCDDVERDVALKCLQCSRRSRKWLKLLATR